MSPRKPTGSQQRWGWIRVFASGYVVRPDLRILVTYTMSDFDNTDTSWSIGGIVDVGSKPVHPAYGPRGSATTSARCCVVVCRKTESGPCKIEPLQASCCRVERNVGEAENELQKTIATARLYDFPTLCRSGGICQLRILYCRKYSQRPH